MSTRSPRFRAYAWLIVAAALAGVWATYTAGIRVPLSPLSATLVVAILASEMLAVQLPTGASISLAYPLCVSAAVLFGPLGAALGAAVSGLPYLVATRAKPLSATLGNVAQGVLSALVPAWLYLLLGGQPITQVPLERDSILALVPALAAVAIGGVVVNFTLGGIGTAMIREMPLRKVWRDWLSWMTSSQVAFGLLGIAIAQVLALAGPAGFALFVIPLVVARQLYQRYLALREAYSDTIRSLVGAIEAKDPYTKGHSVRVSQYVTAIAQTLGQGESATQRLEQAALLHDLGKIGVSRAILSKDGPLTEDEFEEIRRHPDIAARILDSAPHLADLVPVVRYHHERYDGRGYGTGLCGEDIPFEARILAVADSFDAMTSDRPYRPAMSRVEAMAELRRNSGAQFDASVVDAMVEAVLVEPPGGEG